MKLAQFEVARGNHVYVNPERVRFVQAHGDEPRTVIAFDDNQSLLVSHNVQHVKDTLESVSCS